MILDVISEDQASNDPKSNDFVWIEFNGNYGQLFGKKEANSKFVDKIFVEVVINHYSSDNQKALINFSTRAF